MQQILSGGLWDQIEKLAQCAERKLAAVAYVSSDEKVKFGHRDVLVTDASDEAIRAGQTSAAILRAAFMRGAELFSVSGLHAKLLCLGRYVVVGSANLSRNSVGNLVEAALVTDNPNTLAESREFIELLRGTAVKIDDGFLARIEALPVISRSTDSRSSPPVPAVAVPTARVWLVGVSPVSDRMEEAEQALVEEAAADAAENLKTEDSSVSWLRFTGNSAFRRDAQPGDAVIQIWRRSKKSKRATVYFPVPILKRREEPKCTRFYVEDYADEEARSLSLAGFREIWKRAGNLKVPSLSCARLIPEVMAAQLLELWPEPE